MCYEPLIVLQFLLQDLRLVQSLDQRRSQFQFLYRAPDWLIRDRMRLILSSLNSRLKKTIENNSGAPRTRIERTGPWITNLGQNGFGVNSGWVRAPKHIKPVIVFAHFVVFPHPLHQLTASDASSSGF